MKKREKRISPSPHFQFVFLRKTTKGGDPSAGSPTDTLLQLSPSLETQNRPVLLESKTGLIRTPIEWLDGRCVQSSGTYSPQDRDLRLLGIPSSRGRVTGLDPDYGCG